MGLGNDGGERTGVALFVDVSLRAARCASSNHGAGQPTCVPRNYSDKTRSEALRSRWKVGIFYIGRLSVEILYG
jgi:hypothetical protein